jgi:hypothetical protein
MSNSGRTTNFGPFVSFRSTARNTSAPVVEFTGVAPIRLSGITTASPTSTFIPDGHLSIVSHSANSMVIAIRSGATTYRWTNAAGSVL